MSDDEDVEWEYEDESDGIDQEPASPRSGTQGGDADTFQHSPLGNHGDDDDGDVDWEDADVPMEEEQEEGSDLDHDATETTVSDLNAVNWDHINSVLQREADKERSNEDATTKKAKRPAVRMSKEDKAHELALHKSHLLLLLAAQLRMNALCQSRVVRGLLLSLTSDSAALDFFADMETEPLKYALELLVRWFHTHFEVGTQEENDQDAFASQLTENKLLRVVFDRQGSPSELALLFTALCRALGLPTRLAVAMDPLVVQQHSKSAEAAATATPTTAHSKRKRSQRQSSHDDTATRPSLSLWTWCEVLNPKTKSWLTVDAVRKVVNRPQGIGALRGKNLPLSYVVTVEEDGYLTDVSPRYVERWSKTMPRRLAHDWLLRSLQLMNSQIMATGDVDPEVVSLRESERQKLQQLTEAEEMPTSLEAFKKHHLYCLERHLGQLQCIYPRKAVGLFKGHAVFLRKSVQTTRTWYQWRRLGREVRESEKDKPAKRLGKASKGKSGNDGSDDDDDGRQSGEDGGAKRALYGFWQTDEVVPPRVDGLMVPKNKFGNIELWSPAHLPIGAVHLQLPRINKVAEQLGVDFAPALVGFQFRDGANVPQFDGIVVAEAVVEALLDAHAQMQHMMIENAIDKNQQIMAKRWEKLVKRLLLKQRLNEEYGEV